MCWYPDRRSAEVAQPCQSASLVFPVSALPQALLLTHLIRSSRKPLHALVRGQGKRDVGLFNGRAVAAGNQGTIDAVFSQELAHGGRGFRTLDRTSG